MALSLLVPDDPVARVAGMLGELPRYDPDGFTRYLEAFPELAEVPLFGQTTAESVSAETALALGADAAVFGLSGHGPNRASEALVARLEAAGVAVVFIDFRDDPLVNTPKSMRILGQLLGLEARAEDFAALYETEVARVIGPVASIEEPRPSVLLEAHVGLRPGCCFTIARGMLASLIEAAGGRNIAAGRLPGVAGELALEYVITEDPDVYIGTAIGSRSGGTEESGRILLGPGAAQTAAAETLARALERPGIATLSAVRAGHAYAIWHHFYNSPLNVYALQRFAAWLHPDRFHDLDPEATLRRLMERLGPLDLRGAYAVGLDASD